MTPDPNLIKAIIMINYFTEECGYDPFDPEHWDRIHALGEDDYSVEDRVWLYNYIFNK